MTKRQRNILDTVDVTSIHLTKIKSLARAIVSLGDDQQDPADMVTLSYLVRDAAEAADATTLQTFAVQSLARGSLPEAAQS